MNLRCRKEGSYEVPNIGDKQATCLSSPGSWAVPSRRFHFMPQLFFYIPIDTHYWSLSEIWHCVNIWDFLLIQSSCLFLSHFLKCNLSISDSHAFDYNARFVTEFNVSVRHSCLSIVQGRREIHSWCSEPISGLCSAQSEFATNVGLKNPRQHRVPRGSSSRLLETASLKGSVFPAMYSKT